MMPVTDQQAATLRAQLAGNLEEHKRLLAGLATEADRRGYSALLTAAFYNAVDLRFTRDSSLDDVIEFVADVRARSERVRDALDPRIAERVLLAAFTSDNLDDLDSSELTKTKMFLLAAIIADQHLDDAGLDAFLGKARAFADELLS
jgi:hypothetical protein